jgi:hypothetical protein
MKSVGNSPPVAPIPNPGGTSAATKPTARTVTVGESAQYGGYGGAVPGGGLVHGGASTSCTQTATTRGPNTASTSAGVDGHDAYLHAAPPHAPFCGNDGAQGACGSGSHQATTRVANKALSSSPAMAAVTWRASSPVLPSGEAPAEAATRAAFSTLETRLLFCTAHKPASTAARKHSRNSGATKANSSVACDRWRRFLRTIGSVDKARGIPSMSQC